MSCYLCDNYQISALAEFINNHVLETRRFVDDPKDAKEIARILYDENVNSVTARYADHVDDMICSFVFDHQASDDYHQPIAIIKALHNYMYQACEGSNWEDSLAFKLCEKAIKEAVTQIEGYEAAAWGLEKPVYTNLNKKKRN